MVQVDFSPWLRIRDLCQELKKNQSLDSRGIYIWGYKWGEDVEPYYVGKTNSSIFKRIMEHYNTLFGTYAIPKLKPKKIFDSCLHLAREAHTTKKSYDVFAYSGNKKFMTKFNLPAKICQDVFLCRIKNLQQFKNEENELVLSRKYLKDNFRFSYWPLNKTNNLEQKLGKSTNVQTLFFEKIVKFAIATPVISRSQGLHASENNLYALIECNSIQDGPQFLDGVNCDEKFKKTTPPYY